MTKRKPIFLIIFALTFSPALARANGGVLLESLDGDASIKVTGRDGSVRQAKVGDALGIGDSIATAVGVVARVAYEQGAQVLLADSSKVTIGSESEAGATGQVPSIEVESGTVRAVVEKYVDPHPDPSASPSAADSVSTDADASNAPSEKSAASPHKFFIKVKAVILGVRGTDFVVNAGDGSSVLLNTFSGIVDFGNELKTLSKSGVQVGAAQSSRYEPGKTIESPKSFDTADFLKSFNEKYPKLEPVYKKALMEIYDGTLAKNFRQAKADGIISGGLNDDGSPRVIEFPAKKKKKKPAAAP